MQQQNITSAVKHIYLQEQAENAAMWQEVLQESSNGLSDDVLNRVRALTRQEKENKIIPFPTHRVKKLAEVKLLAAAGQNLGEWFSQPLLFTSAGFMIDVRRIKGKSHDVDVYFKAIDGKNGLMESLFDVFKDKSIKVTFSVNGVNLLSADVYVDNTAHQAEGSGVVFDNDVDLSSGNLEINVDVDE
jgi:hypothetical protein